MILTSDFVAALSPERNFFFSLVCLGDQKFRFHLRLCSLGIKKLGILIRGRSEILNPFPVNVPRWIKNLFLCSLGDQKFWILFCLCRGSEILNPSLCSLRIRNSETFFVFFGDQKFWILSCVVWEIWNFESRDKKFQIGIVYCLEEIFDSLQTGKTLSSNTILRFREYCKNHIWNKVEEMDFRLNSTFYLRPILHTFPKELPSLRRKNKYSPRPVSIFNRRSSHFWSDSQYLLWILSNRNTTF